jgi:phage I-like protein
MSKSRIQVGIGTHGQLISAKVGGEAPEWMLIFPSPVYTTDDGEFVVDDLAKQLVIEAFERRGNDLVIDYEHQTLGGGEAPAAGWIKELVSREDGLYGRVEWTDRAREFVASGEYRYDSPVYDYDWETRRVLKLHHVALTNWPRTHNRTELSEQQLAAKARAKYGNEAKEEGSMKKFIEKLKAALGQSAAKAKSEIEAALAEYPANPEEAAKTDGIDAGVTLGSLVVPPAPVVVASKEVLEILELPTDANLATVQAKVIGLKTPVGMVAKADHDKVVAELAAAKTQIATLSAKSEDDKLEALVSANKAKLPPAKEKEIRAIAKAHGLEHATKVVELLEVVHPAQAAAKADESPAPPKEEIATAKVTVGGQERSAIAGSVTLSAKVEAHQAASAKAGKTLTYAQAYDELRTRGEI